MALCLHFEAEPEGGGKVKTSFGGNSGGGVGGVQGRTGWDKVHPKSSPLCLLPPVSASPHSLSFTLLLPTLSANVQKSKGMYGIGWLKRKLEQKTVYISTTFNPHLQSYIF